MVSIVEYDEESDLSSISNDTSDESVLLQYGYGEEYDETPLQSIQDGNSMEPFLFEPLMMEEELRAAAAARKTELSWFCPVNS